MSLLLSGPMPMLSINRTIYDIIGRQEKLKEEGQLLGNNELNKHRMLTILIIHQLLMTC